MNERKEKHMDIPVCIPVVPRKAKEYVNAVIDKNWISSACHEESVNFIRKLEEEFSKFIGVRYGIAVTSGTTALDLAIATLKIGKGDEVIVPSFTMIATANSVIHNGACPVFVDVDLETLCIDVNLIERAISEKTRAIIPVHIYGYPANIEGIMKIARKYNLFVIEDAAEAIGTEYKYKRAGSFGDISCFSFYANKLITSGEGGMVVTDNKEYAERAAMLKDQAFSQPRFVHEDIGFNFRMNNLTAAYAYASFEEVDEYIKKRIQNAELYNRALSGIEGITLPPKNKAGIKNSYWVYSILIDEKKYGRSKPEVRELLRTEYGIDSRDFFYPMHKQPIMIKKGYVKEAARMLVSEKLWEEGLYLPSSTNIKENQIKYIADALIKIKR